MFSFVMFNLGYSETLESLVVGRRKVKNVPGDSSSTATMQGTNLIDLTASTIPVFPNHSALTYLCY